MRLSTAGRYALRAMVDLALHQDQEPVLRRDIAERQEISSQYLAQLLSKLRRAGLVDSVLGPGGGYTLARGAAEISAGDILRAVEEPLTPVECIDGNGSSLCHRAENCPTRPLWLRLEAEVARVLDSIMLDELCEPSVQSALYGESGSKE